MLLALQLDTALTRLSSPECSQGFAHLSIPSHSRDVPCEVLLALQQAGLTRLNLSALQDKVGII
jgi:hypothetical protein